LLKLIGIATCGAPIEQTPVSAMADRTRHDRPPPSDAITLILPHPGDPQLYEPEVRSAKKSSWPNG